MENVKLLFQLYYRPAAAMSDIIDKGSWLFAAVAMLVVLFVFQYGVNARIAQTYQVSKFSEYLQNSNFTPDTAKSGHLTQAQLEEARHIANMDIEKELALKPFPVLGRNILYFVSFESFFISPLISLLLFFVPALLILSRILGTAGYAGTNARNNYMPLSACVMMAWTAAHLPFAIAAIVLFGRPVDGSAFLLMWLISGLLFGLLAVFAVRTVLGVNYGSAIMLAAISAFAFTVGMYVFRYISPFLFSPFLIIMAIVYFGGFLRGEAAGFGNAFRQRQNFKRFLHNSTINPRDADAHVQLAIIYLQRKQDAKALEHLNKAFEIDPQEIDANYELGKFARRGKDLQKALDHFSVVVEQNDKHALSEIWREIGATYLEAGMYKEALDALETFSSRRPFDAEGLYYLGKIYKAQGETEKAREAFEQAVEAAKNSPDYRRHEIRQWGKLAQKEI
jgi:tetratricopeptide (TPR) repeat protein